MKLSQLGEFGLIERIRKLQKFRRQDTIVGIGDDAAVLKIQRYKIQDTNKSKIINSKSQKLILITTDALIEDVHFKLKTISFFDLGRKALMVNISDIAAMGGVPTHALVTIGLPKKCRVEDVDEFYKGLNKLAGKYHIDLIGGDTVSSPKALMISIALLGEVEKENLLTRSGARIGDAVLVTGRFGGPASRNFQHPTSPPARHGGPAGRAGKFQINPNFQILKFKQARRIAVSRLATAMIDSSDGLARSVHEICKSSGVGARIFSGQVPIAKGATLDQALYGGEEYELVFTAPVKNVKQTQKMINCVIIGQVTSKGLGVKLINRNKEETLGNGFDHFR